LTTSDFTGPIDEFFEYRHGALPYRSQSLNLLLPDQKLKLPILLQALQLQSAAWQATNLNLIDGPTPRVLPADFDGGIGTSTFPGVSENRQP
jgi:hypothetical protein